MHAGVQQFAAAAEALGQNAGFSMMAGFLVGFFILFFVLVVILTILILVGMWKVYAKAGVPGWASLVPVYNYVKLLEILQMPLWLIVFMLVPVANIALSIVVACRLARAFGRGGWFAFGLIVLPFIFYPILGFGSSKYERSMTGTGITEAAKWTIIGCAVLGAIYYAMFFLSFGTSAPVSHGLTAIAGNSGYYTDGTNVYLDDAVIPGADVNSFYTQGDYALDNYGVYYQGVLMPDANPRTFTVISLMENGYALDDSAVYFAGSAIPDADPSTFIELDSDYGKDATQAYYDGTTVENADAETFSVPRKYTNYATDDAHVYFAGAVMPGADPKSFVFEDGTISGKPYDTKDKNHYYSYGENALNQ